MKIEEREDFVDVVAQAVIDKIEERDRTNGLVEMVVARVLAMQKRDADVKTAALAEQNGVFSGETTTTGSETNNAATKTATNE